MATRRYKWSPGYTKDQVVDEVGAAVNANTVELTVDLVNTTVHGAKPDGTGTRTISREEVLRGLEMIRERIIEHVWPPA